MAARGARFFLADLKAFFRGKACVAANNPQGANAPRPNRPDRSTLMARVKGKRAHGAAADPLVGLYFHALREDGSARNQGKVIAAVAPGSVYLVLYFEWRGGSASSTELLWVEDMRRCRFYQDGEEMREAFDHILPKGDVRGES